MNDELTTTRPLSAVTGASSGSPHCTSRSTRSAGGGTISLSGVYGGIADPLPMMVLFDEQVQLRMGQANFKRWVDDILPLLTDDDPLGVESFATHRLALDEAPRAYQALQEKMNGTVKVLLHPGRRP